LFILNKYLFQYFDLFLLCAEEFLVFAWWERRADSLPLLLQGAARQQPGIDGFDVGRLDCRNIDLALAYYYYVISRLGRADPDGEHQGPFTCGSHA
jgi:hypothetical protein